MAECKSRAQRKARRNYLCGFCFGIIEKGCEYVLITGIGNCNAGWYNLKRHIHCDALANRCMELTHSDKRMPSASEVYDVLLDECQKIGCANLHNCTRLRKDSFVAYKRMFACETVVGACLPEGPVRNAALQSIRENKGNLNSD